MRYLVKNIPDSVKDVDLKSRTVTLYFSKFDVLDSDKDRIVKGAFTKTFKEWGPGSKNRIWHLEDHNPTRKLGKPRELLEDDFGGLAVSQIRDTTLGRDIITLYEAGDITEHSFGFSTEKGDQNDDGGLDIKEVMMFEYSAVAWGANMFTPTVSVKSQHELIENINKWSKWLRKGNLTDDTCELLEIQLLQWESQLKTLLSEQSQSGDTLTVEGKQSQSGGTFKLTNEEIFKLKNILTKNQNGSERIRTVGELAKRALQNT